MGRHYSTRDFFQQMPNRLLARYFERRGVLAGLDFAAIRETQTEELFAAWLKSPEGERNRMDTEFRETSALSCERGFRAILDEAAWHFEGNPDEGAAFAEKLAALDDHADRAILRTLRHTSIGIIPSPVVWNGSAVMRRRLRHRTLCFARAEPARAATAFLR